MTWSAALERLYAFVWHFARTYIAGCRVEVAHLVPPEGFPTSSEGAGIWEAGQEIWPRVNPPRHAPK